MCSATTVAPAEVTMAPCRSEDDLALRAGCDERLHDSADGSGVDPVDPVDPVGYEDRNLVALHLGCVLVSQLAQGSRGADLASTPSAREPRGPVLLPAGE